MKERTTLYDWANKLSLNGEKNEYLFLQKQSAPNSISLRLLIITFNSIETKVEHFMKLLWEITDKNAIWNKHIERVKNEKLKIIVILCCASHYLVKKV